VIPYEELEHTADLAIRAYGSTREQLFENAALGMFSLLWDVDPDLAAPASVRVSLSDDDGDCLLRRWLSELLYHHESDGIAFSRFSVSLPAGDGLRGQAWGLSVDDLGESIQSDIKAVTYHGLRITRVEGRYQAEIIFDV
jgi:SHS2 domain-containing protein